MLSEANRATIERVYGKGSADLVGDALLNRLLDAARAESQYELLEAIKLRDLYRSRLCQTCLGTRRLHIVEGCTQPAHDIDCPTCVGIRIGGSPVYRAVPERASCPTTGGKEP